MIKEEKVTKLINNAESYDSPSYLKVKLGNCNPKLKPVGEERKHFVG